MDGEGTRKNFKRESVPAGCAEEISVDWRGKPSKPNKHGGMTAAVFVLGLSLFSLFLNN